MRKKALSFTSSALSFLRFLPQLSHESSRRYLWSFFPFAKLPSSKPPHPPLFVIVHRTKAKLPSLLSIRLSDLTLEVRSPISTALLRSFHWTKAPTFGPNFDIIDRAQSPLLAKVDSNLSLRQTPTPGLQGTHGRSNPWLPTRILLLGF
ncbi:hypothetical protein M5K25_013533 [Dendrobium thyrsiflorum]|uniref:Uncharacterized protein n=1 Tax=Dendrobium thyrsiflorum TaxID=117978 RepID=A0ABD0UTH8_DENTH